MAKRRRIGEFPQNVVGDQRLPSRIVVDERLDVLLQEVGSDCHLIVLIVGQAAFNDTSCGPSGWSAGEVREASRLLLLFALFATENTFLRGILGPQPNY